MNNNQTKQFDTKQLQAINASNGYFLVLASPGCGKTDILAERVATAVENGVNLSDMLCLTFTNRASRGMLDRISTRFGNNDTDQQDIFVGNVHRFCSNFLFSHGLLNSRYCIIDEEEMTDILIEIDRSIFTFESRNRSGFMVNKTMVTRADNLESYILMCNNDVPKQFFHISESDYAPYYKIAKRANFDHRNINGTSESERFTSAVLEYMEHKRHHMLVSFSEIIIKAYVILHRDTERRFKRYSWVQVDEVQDLNMLQLAIIDELTDTSSQFTAMYLGDEQQAIFSFLGAKFGLLQTLKNRCGKNFISLGNNYRSPKYLLDIFNEYAESVLYINREILPQAANSNTNHSRLDLIITGNNTPDDESARITDMVKYYQSLPLESEYDRGRIAILVPTNVAADRISKSLDDNGILNFKISGTDIFKSAQYKAISSVLAICVNEFNNMAWARLLHGIGIAPTLSAARNMYADLTTMKMTPMDLIQQHTYAEQFCKIYEEGEIVFFDTETSGLNVLEDDIIQIAAFKVRNGKTVEGSELNILMHTDKAIPKMLGDIPNPLIEEYASRPHLSRAESLEMFLKYIGNSPVLGHNVTYDYQILRNNVRRTLGKEIRLKTFDSLHIAKLTHPLLKRYKLGFLLEELHLEGENSHLADADIAATKMLTDHCYEILKTFVPKQIEYIHNAESLGGIPSRLSALAPLFDMIQDSLYEPTDKDQHCISSLMQRISDFLTNGRYIAKPARKFQLFLDYSKSEWEEGKNYRCLFDQVAMHINDITASLSEGDLINAENIILERVFVMTIHKGKGLEFENVIILGANKGTFPFYTAINVLDNQYQHTSKEIKQAKQDIEEDARKFYVALTRAKKRLCISYSLLNSRGFPAGVTPFLKPIAKYFTIGNKKSS